MCSVWFGTKHGSNFMNALLSPVFRKIRSMGVHVVEWVDDSLYVCPNTNDPSHDPMLCGGRKSCHFCEATFAKAEEVEALVDQLFQDLGFLTNEENTAPAQEGEFIGICFDSKRSVFHLTAEKASSLAQEAAELLASSAPTPRDVSRFRGKLHWFTPCLEGVSILTREMNAYVGGPDEAGWDTHQPFTTGVRDELQFWVIHIMGMAEVARPMVTTPATILLQRFLAGLPSVDYVISHDSSNLGYGAILQAHASRGGAVHKISSRWNAAEVQDLWQAHLEMLGGVKAISTVLPTIKGCSVLHLTDCTPVKAAINKGSKGSPFLQKHSVALWRMLAAWNVHLTSDWITGREMIDAGVDDLSRDLTLDAHDVRLTADAWIMVQQLAQNENMELHVDYFSDEHNHLCSRFWSRYSAPGAEGADALSAPSWGVNHCSVCNQYHTQGIFLFPPGPLIHASVAKAKRDRAHGVLVAQRRSYAAWWSVLMAGCEHHNIIAIDKRASFTQFGVDKHPELKRYIYSSGDWFLFCFDFGSESTHSYSQVCFNSALHATWTSPGLSPSLLGHTKHLQALQAQHLLQGTHSVS